MSCVDDVMALTSHGYKMNPYIGCWTKKVGSRRAEILPMPDRSQVSVYEGRELKDDIIAMSLAKAIEAGDRWLEACDAE